MRGIGNKIFAAEARAEAGDLHPLPRAQLREADTGAARFDQILAAFEQDPPGQLIGFLLAANRLSGASAETAHQMVLLFGIRPCVRTFR